MGGRQREGGGKGQEGGRAREEESLEGICDALVDKQVILPFSMRKRSMLKTLMNKEMNVNCLVNKSLP